MTKAEIMAALEGELTVPLWPTAGKALGYSRNTTYEAARHGDIPGAFRIRNNWRVATAPLRQRLGLDQQAA